MSRLANEGQMRAMVARWRVEGGSAVSFAIRHRISPAKFGYWRRRVERRGASEGIEFRPVQVIDAALPSRPLLEIMLVGGERVVVHEGASAELVTAAVSVLRRCAPCGPTTVRSPRMRQRPAGGRCGCPPAPIPRRPLRTSGAGSRPRTSWLCRATCGFRSGQCSW